MLKHQNPEELADDEVKEGEILPPETPSMMPKGPTAKELFKYETDLDYLASEGHVIWRRLNHFSNVSRAGAVVGLLMMTTAIGAIWHVNRPSAWISEHIPNWLTFSSANVAADNMAGQPQATTEDTSDRSRSWLGRVAWSLIGFDETKAVTLPDGQQVHAYFSFLNDLPPSRAGKLDAEGFRKLIDNYKETITWQPSEDEKKQAEAKEYAARLEENSAWNTEAWSVRYRIATAGMLSTKPADMVTVPAQGFWKTESNIENMATDGVIATSRGNYYAAAYVGGVPAISMFTPSACYTIMGVGYEGCRPLSQISESGIDNIRSTLWGNTPEQIAAAPASSDEREVGEEGRWYLNFQLMSDSSTLAQGDLDNLIKAIDADARQPNGITLHTSITSAVSTLPAPAMTAPAKGLLRNPAAIDAMKKGGVVGTTGVLGRVVVAAYVDNKIQLRLRTEGGLCRTILGDRGYGCPTDDFNQRVELQDLVKSLYEKPDTGAENLKPYFWFAAAPTTAEKSVELEAILAAFGPVMDDAVNYGVDIRRWTFTRKLPAEAQPLITRPEGFFQNPNNIAALSNSEFVDKDGNVSRNTGVVIIPKEMKDTLFLAVNYRGHLSLNVVELLPRGEWDCWTIFGSAGQPLGQCKSHELTKYADIVKSMLEPKSE